MDPTTENIKKYLLLDVQDGKYSFGELIVPIKLEDFCIERW